MSDEKPNEATHECIAAGCKARITTDAFCWDHLPGGDAEREPFDVPTTTAMGCDRCGATWVREEGAPMCRDECQPFERDDASDAVIDKPTYPIGFPARDADETHAEYRVRLVRYGADENQARIEGIIEAKRQEMAPHPEGEPHEHVEWWAHGVNAALDALLAAIREGKNDA